MTITLGTPTPGATSVSIPVSAGMPASGTIDFQVSHRADFQFCVCPIISVARSSPISVSSLNQASRYFARARGRLGDGSLEDWSNTVGFYTPQSTAQDLTVPSVLIDPAIIMKPEPIVSWAPGSEVAGFPARNVSRDSPVGWKSGNSPSITLGHGGAPIDTIAILNTNIPEASTVTVRGGASAAGASSGTILANAVPFRASANVPGRPGHHGLVRLAAPVSHPFIYIAIGASAPGGTSFIEHIAIGLNRKSHNHTLEKNESPVHLGSKERTRTGVADLTPGMKMRRVEFDLAWLREANSETLYHDVMTWMDDTVFVVPNSKAGAFLHDRMLYGDLKGSRVTQTSSLHYSRTFIIESLI